MTRRLIVAVVVGALVASVAGAVTVVRAGGGSVLPGGVIEQFPPIAGTGLLSEARTSPKFPAKGGFDGFQSMLDLVIVDGPGCLGQTMEIRLAGPTLVNRSDRVDRRRDVVQTELVSMSLTGFHPSLGDVVVRESPTQASTGRVKQIGRDPRRSDRTDFPAHSFFDVFVLIDVQRMTLHNQDPIRMENRNILAIPPIGSEYRGTGVPVPLFDVDNNPTPFCIAHAAHVPEDPSHIIMFRELTAIEKKLDFLCANHGAPGCV